MTRWPSRKKLSDLFVRIGGPLFARRPTAILVTLVLAWTAALLAPAHANDGVASMAGGGLSFAKSDIVRMQSETLTIDLNEPRIYLRYEFVNPSSDPETLQVAFPLPLISIDSMLGFGDSQVDLNVNTAEPYVDFKTTINEQEHATQRILELLWNGEVIATRTLAKGEAYGEASKQIYAEHAPVTDKQNPWESITKPELTGIRLTYLWDYTFYSTDYEDAQPIVVQHSYTPVFGAFVEAILDPMQYEWEDPKGQPISGDEKEEWYGPLRRTRCLDAPRNYEQVLQLMEFKRSRPDDVNLFPRALGFWGTRSLSYILTTANTWAGSIDDFKLIIKASPNIRYVFCEEDYGIPSFAPGEVSYHVQHFKPSRELEFEIVDLLPHWRFTDDRAVELALQSQTLQWTPGADAKPAYVCKLNLFGDNSLSARDKPSAKGKELARLHAGTYVQVLEKKDRWQRLRLPDGQEAWASSKYLCD